MLYIKALHIIFVVTWFSGLFYIVRLFIYHSEAQEKPAEEKKILQSQFKVMEKRLWHFITVPSMFLAVFSGLYLAMPYYAEIEKFPWLLLKLAFVTGLILYHLQTGVIFKQMQHDVIKYSSYKLRIWNEIATLFLVAIVFIIVLKNTLDFLWGFVGIIALGICLWMAIRLYKKIR